MLYRKMVAKIKLKRLYKPYSQTLFLLFILKYFYYFTIILVFYSKYFTSSLDKEGLILILINNKCNYKSLTINSISLNSKKRNRNLIIFFFVSIHYRTPTCFVCWISRWNSLCWVLKKLKLSYFNLVIDCQYIKKPETITDVSGSST